MKVIKGMENECEREKGRKMTLKTSQRPALTNHLTCLANYHNEMMIALIFDNAILRIFTSNTQTHIYI